MSCQQVKGQFPVSILRRMLKFLKMAQGVQRSRHGKRSGLRPLVGVERLDPRLVLSGSPLGAMVQDTGEYLLGSSTVTVVLMESTGAASSEDWDPASITAVKNKVEESLAWWENTLTEQSPVHRLSFVTDYQYTDSPVPTSVEPIAEKSNVYTTWVNDFLDVANANTSDGISADVRKFNHSQRVHHGADWGFTIFVVNDANDSDGMFAEGGSFRRAFAFAGGRFMIVPAGRPASTFAHEIGHMFWARDEYPGGGSYSDHRGYYNAQNINAHDNPTQGFVQQPSIMASGSLMTTAYDNNTSSQSSFEMLGWRDSDDDGVFDVLDVPHTLEGSGQQNGTEYHFQATASVNAMVNANSSGFQSDITLNTIDRIEYRFDDGPWIVDATPGLAELAFEFTVDIPDGAGQIEVRTRSVDATSQQTIAQSTPFVADLSAKTVQADEGLAGYVWLDSNGDDQWTNSENGVQGVTVRLIDVDGNLLSLSNSVDADGYADADELDSRFSGVSLSAVGTHILDASVYSREDPQATTGSRVFANFNAGTNSVVKTWGQKSRTLRATFTAPQSVVAITSIADDFGDVARLEAYDASGQLLERVTSPVMTDGETVQLSVSRPESDIAYVIARAHYNTEVLFDDLRIGPSTESVTDSQGVFRFQGLPDEDYRVEVLGVEGLQLGTPSILGRSLDNQIPVVDLAFGLDSPPWLNPSNSEDINNDGMVSPIDALVIINDLNASGARELPPPTDSVKPPPFLDSSGDGWVTSIDALRVINLLNANAEAEAEGETQPFRWAAEYGLNSARVALRSELSAPSDLAETIQLESSNDYRYHCLAVDLTLELWFAEKEICGEDATLDEVEVSGLA